MKPPEVFVLGCAGIFAPKRNEAKRKRNYFRFEAKKKVSFASFRFEAKRKKEKQNGNETVREAKQKSPKKRNRAKRNEKDAKESKRKAKSGERFEKGFVNYIKNSAKASSYPNRLPKDRDNILRAKICRH
jgi:hypothetical protein